MNEISPNNEKVPVSNWRYIITPIIIFLVSILSCMSIGRNGDMAMALLIGGAMGFALTLMWIFMSIVSLKSPDAKIKISVKKMILVGVFSFAGFMFWLIIIYSIYK